MGKEYEQMKENKHIQDPSEKVELAKKIANQSKKVTNAYTSFEETIFRAFRFISSLIDRLFFSRKYLILVSLVLAILLYLSVNISDSNGFNTPLLSAKTISSLSVNARYNSESFEISGLPATCEVVLTGDAANVNNAASRSGYCLANLEGYTEGTHSIKLEAYGFGDNVTATVTPTEAVVTLKRKTTRQFTLGYEYINQNSLDSRYTLGTPVFADGNVVNIRASEDTLNSIAFVKALIDVSNQSSDFKVEAPLVAYDEQGQVVNAEIVPSTVTASVTVSSPHKTVPIVLNVTGEMEEGLAIDSVQMDHQTTTIYAPESVLAGITSVEVTLDASTLTRNSEIVVPITLPNGVNSSDVTRVNLTVTVSPEENKVLENVPIIYRNNNQGYGAQDASLTSVNVTVSGSVNNIANVTANDIVVFFDVADLEPGTYDLPLQIEQNTSNFITCSLDNMTVTITLVEQ